MFKVDIGAIKDKRGEKEHYSLRENFDALETGAQRLTFNGPVKVELDITNSGNFFWAAGQVACTVRLACERCLEQFDYAVEAEFAEKYCPSSKQKSSEKAEDTSEEDCITFSGNIIDISEEVEKVILMALPMKILCSPGCKGLCSRCGQNLNVAECNCVEEDIDPRLEELKKLLDGKKGRVKQSKKK